MQPREHSSGVFFPLLYIPSGNVGSVCRLIDRFEVNADFEGRVEAKTMVTNHARLDCGTIILNLCYSIASSRRQMVTIPTSSFSASCN